MLTQRPLIIACGALAQELRAVLRADHLDQAVEVVYLAANLHNRPERIVPELRPLLTEASAARRPAMVAYADCGTGGLLDALLAEFPGVSRLPGSHCYETFAGSEAFGDEHEAEPGTLYLTDFLAKHFDALMWVGLGLDRHPELLPMYFANYTRVLWLAQTHSPTVEAAARAAADRLGLRFEQRYVGMGGLATPITGSIRVAITQRQEHEHAA